MTLMEQGNYMGQIVAMQVTEPKSADKSPQIVIEFDLLDGDNRPTGTRRSVYLSLSDKALTSWVERELNDRGFNWDFVNPRMKDEYYAAPGVELYCKHEPYQGKTSEKWQFSNGGGLGKPAEKATLAALQSRFRHKTQTVIAPGTKPTPPAPSPTRAAPSSVLVRSSVTDKPIPMMADINECYGHFVAFHEGKTTDQIKDEWDQCVLKVQDEFGVDYLKFGSAQFVRLYELAEAPF